MKSNRISLLFIKVLLLLCFMLQIVRKHPTLCAILIRTFIVLITHCLIDDWISQYLQWYYTDIDYFVYSDAAAFMLNGDSPYERITYRYNPFLAFLMLANHFFHPLSGKLLFCIADSLMIPEIRSIRYLLYKDSTATELWSLFWIFNPFSIYLCSRGSCDAISSWMILVALRCLLSFSHQRSHNLSTILLGLIHGVVIWFRVYPILYVPSFAMYVMSTSHSKRVWSYCLIYLCATWTALTGLTFFSYVIYGQPYVQESLLYHLFRQDHRHNFSSFFYPIYLEKSLKIENLPSNSLLVSMSRISLCLLFVTLFLFLIYFLRVKESSFRLVKCLFATTFLFVATNKVCTGQYFLWIFIFLPLLPASWFSSKQLRWYHSIALVVLVVVFLGWLSIAAQLEILGVNRFLLLWKVSIALLIANFLFMHCFFFLSS